MNRHINGARGRAELEGRWNSLKREMAHELIKKVDLQMPFYGKFSNIPIDETRLL